VWRGGTLSREKWRHHSKILSSIRKRSNLFPNQLCMDSAHLGEELEDLDGSAVLKVPER